jgi:hypothetical protein
MSDASGAPSGAGPNARIEAAIAAYPHISPDQLAELLHWYRREASSLDVATLASRPNLQEGYRRFRADHIDRFDAKDWLKLIAAIAVTGVLIFIIATKFG